MMKVERNDFSCFERIFKMAVNFVPIYVLVECCKLIVPDSEEVLSADESTAVASRVVDELMGLKGYLRFGVYTETVGEKDATGPSEQFLIREFSLADKDQSEVDDEHIYVPSVTAQEFWESLPSFVQMAIFTFGKGHSADELATQSKKIMLSAIQALKEAILTALNDMEHEYETAYIKAALIRSHHLEPHISFSVFLRAICNFSRREYKYDPAQRVDTVIYHDEKEFMTSKSSKWQRGRRIV